MKHPFIRKVRKKLQRPIRSKAFSDWLAAALKFTIAETQHAILRHGAEGNVKAVDMLEAQLQEYKKAAFEIVSAPVFQKEVEL